MNKDAKSGGPGLVYEDPYSQWADETGPNPAVRDIHFGERRAGADRRDRTVLRANEIDSRKGNDRRRLRIGITVRTGWAVERMADWLETNCRGKWSMVLSDIGRGQDVQEINVMFERETDKDAFIRVIASGRGEIV